jgi:16S rRNA processing protein RimM
MPDGPYIPVARIVRPHGVQGELSVTPTLDVDLDTLVGEEAWVVPPVRIAEGRTLDSVRPGPKGTLVKLSGIDDVDAARACANKALSIHRSLVPAEALVAEFDPVGCAVRDAERGSLGTIEEVIITGANDVWVVRGEYGEVLIPVIEDVIAEVGEEERVIHVRLLPGLIEE